MKRRASIALALFGLLAGACPAPAQVAATLGLAEAPPAELVVGSSILLEAKIEGGDGTTPWTIDQAGTNRWLTHGPLMLDLTTLNPPSERARALRLRALVTRAGDTTVPPLTLRQEGNETLVQTNSVSINAKSALGAEDKEPIWILPLLPYGSWNTPLIVAICFAALALLAGFFHLMTKGLRRGGRAAGLTAYERTRRELAALETYLASRPELGIEECKQFSFDLSALLRRYASSVYAADFLDLTDREIAERAAEVGMDPAKRSELGAILEQIAEVRYSRKLIAADVALKILRRAGSLASAMSPPALDSRRPA